MWQSVETQAARLTESKPELIRQKGLRIPRPLASQQKALSAKGAVRLQGFVSRGRGHGIALQDPSIRVRHGAQANELFGEFAQAGLQNINSTACAGGDHPLLSTTERSYQRA